MERTHGQLRTRLTDGLCRDDANHFATLYHAGRSQVASVALRTNAATRFAGKHRTDFDGLQRRFLDGLGNRLRDLLTGLAEHLGNDTRDLGLDEHLVAGFDLARGDDVLTDRVMHGVARV